MKQSFSRFLAVTLAVAMVLTCAISGFILPVAAEDTATEPTFGVNLFTNKTYTKTIAIGVSGDQGDSYAVDEPLLAGFRYVIRFVAKGPSMSISPEAGDDHWGEGILTEGTTEWVKYQTAFTLTALTNPNKLWISITNLEPDRTDLGDCQIKDLELLYAPADGRFNLVHNGDMEQSTAQNVLQIQIDEGGAEITKDPLGSGGNVLHLKKSGAGTSKSSLPSIFDTLDYSKAFKIKMRLYGCLRFTNYANLDAYMNNPSATKQWGSGQHVSYESRNGWTTIEFYIDIKNNFQDMNWHNTSTGGAGNDYDTYIDDVEIYEVEPVATDWTIDPITELDAVSGEHNLQAMVTTTPANACPYGYYNDVYYDEENQAVTSAVYLADAITPFSWTLTNGNAGTTEVVTTTAAGILTLAKSTNTWSLADVKPTVTVTNGSKTLTTNLEWVYAKYPLMNGDFEQGTYGWNGNNGGNASTRIVAGVGYNGSTAYYVPVDGSGSIYTNQSIFLKPNSTYRATAMWYNDSEDAASSMSMGIYPNAIGVVENLPSRPSGTACNHTWYTTHTYFTTSDSPGVGHDDINVGRGTKTDGYNVSTAMYVDNIVLELVDDNTDIIIDGSFEAANAGTVRAEQFNSGLSFDHILPGEIEGGIGGNTSGMLKVNPGIAASDKTSTFWPIDYSRFEPFHVYEISFKHYGDAGSFTAITWSQPIVAAGGGTTPMKAAEEWIEYKTYFVPGYSIVNSGNWSYLFDFASPDATEPYYIDDFSVKEVQSVYTMRGHNHVDAPIPEGGSNPNVANPVFTDYDQKQALYGTITMKAGTQSLTNSTVRPVTAGTTITVTLTPKDGYLPVPGTLKAVTLSGKEVDIFNTALKPMTKSAGNEFTFTAPDETVYVTCEFAEIATTQGFQWGTVASSVYRDNGVITQMRSLNRLYMDGLDWSAEKLTTTVEGVEYTVKEIGAVARVAGSSEGELSETNYGLKGICYQDGNPNVKVTDYTQRYFDFTVVIKIDDSDEARATKYEWRAYMILENADGQLVYRTDSNIDSVDEAVSRGA